MASAAAEDGADDGGGPHLFTLGHSTRSAAATVALLRSFAVGRVIDVRSIRGSRHNPQFGAEAMAGWLAEARLDYRYLAALGGRRRAQSADPAVNAGWTHPSFHRYADYALTEDFAGGLAALGKLVDIPAAILCAEAVPWRCHRSLIATVLTVRGWRVDHILGPGQLIRHQPGAWGAAPAVAADGTVTYPAAQPTLPL